MNEDIKYVVNEFIKKINEYKDIADSKGVSYGYIHGSSVVINGISYPYSLAVEININQGDYVACILTQDRYTVVVVGKWY